MLAIAPNDLIFQIVHIKDCDEPEPELQGIEDFLKTGITGAAFASAAHVWQNKLVCSHNLSLVPLARMKGSQTQ